MKKLELIKKDLETLGDKGYKVFGTYPVQNMKKGEGEGLEITAIDLIEELEYYKEVDFYNLTGVDFDDYIYDDKEGNTTIIEVELENSYNWSCSVTFQYRAIKVRGKEYIAFAFHRFGDVRGNYTDYAIFDMNREELPEFLFAIQKGITKTINGDEYYITQNLMSEHGRLDVCNASTYNDFTIYCDDDNLEKLILEEEVVK